MTKGKEKDNEQSSLKKSNKRHIKNALKKAKRIKNCARK
jgi:hypothetical protein